MGLDMYLHKETYVKNWDHYKPEDRYEITVLQGGQPCKGIKPERISEISEQVAYWRKANHIHKWFVDNVQDGNDDCGRHYVGREQLEELRDLCRQVLDTCETVEGDVRVATAYSPETPDGKAITEPGRVVTNKKMAADLLPTQSGFFFGGTEYDEYYLEDVKYTEETLTALLAEKGDGYFYYSSSW